VQNSAYEVGVIMNDTMLDQLSAKTVIDKQQSNIVYIFVIAKMGTTIPAVCTTVVKNMHYVSVAAINRWCLDPHTANESCQSSQMIEVVPL